MTATATRPKRGTPAQPVFEAAVGSVFTDEDARKIGPVLLQLEDTHGEATPQLVLDEARRKTSPLHAHFVWDDTEAAERYRIEQAAYLLRSIKIVVSLTGGETISTRLMVSVGPRRYKNVQAALANDEDCQHIIEAARASLQAWQTKYDSYRRMFTQFRDTFEEVFVALERI